MAHLRETEPITGTTPHARSLRQIVKRLLSAPSGTLGPTLLVQRNERDAVLLFESEYLIVLLASDPDEDLASTLPERLDAAFAAEGGPVREAVDHDTMWVIPVDCGRPLSKLGLVPGKPTGELGIKPQFLRIEDGALCPDELVGGRSHPSSCRETLSAALRSRGHSLGPGGIRARERAGEHALASETDAARRTRSAYPAFVCMGLLWVGLGVAAHRFGGFQHQHVLERMGASDPFRVWWEGEWWRLLTAPYLHASWEHLYANLVGAGFLGLMVAGSLGTWRTLALFQTSALAGGALVLWTSRATVVGASGGVFGLLGAMIVLAKLEGGAVPLRGRRGSWLLGLLWLGFNAVASFRPGVSLAAHVGGFLAGVALTLSRAVLVGLPPLDAPAGTAVRYEGAFVAFVLCTGLLTVAGFATGWMRYSPWHP